MPISINTDEKIARLRADLRMGMPILVTTDTGQWLVAAVETLSDERLSEFREFKAPIQIALTKRRAATLAAPAYDTDLVRIEVPSKAPVRWLHAMADPSLDLAEPMKGPFLYVREASADIHRACLALCKKSGLLPCLISLELKNPDEATKSSLNKIPLETLKEIEATRSPIELVSGARVPLHVNEASRVQVYRSKDGGEEHYAIEIGKPARDEPVLSRLHSACFTGDLIGSLKCDCGPQLRAALNQIGENGSGVLLYLNQEGRGIGLANKMRAYALQDQGFDTVEANHRLGFEDDERDFLLGAEILKFMGFKSVRLMTNNPNKIEMMNKAGVSVVERVPLRVGENKHNEAYLATKAKKSGHML